MHYPAKDKHKAAAVSATRPALLFAGHVTRCYRKTVFRPNGTNDWVISYTLGGKAIYTQPCGEFEAGPGDLIILAPGSYHHYAPVEPGGWDCLWAHVLPRPTWLPVLQTRASGESLYRYAISDTSTRGLIRAAFFRTIKYAQSAPAALSGELALNALEEVVWLLARESALNSGTQRVSAPIRSVQEHLANNLAEDQSLESLAKLAHLSPSRLVHRFKDETGESVIACLLRLRLQHAARLLEFTEQSVKEIAAESGFKSPFYFTRQFHRANGASPRTFRAERRSK